ncbi:MAG: glycosyltransferase [Chitinophagales bacterium]|nr:glycosyltransferase [Chitinophagales bacterium]MDW8418907.1 glycosyltransferase [Chitinophagales bacterium]
MLQTPEVLYSIVVPCYNPPAGWAENLLNHLRGYGLPDHELELVLINDGSKINFTEKDTDYLQQNLLNTQFILLEKNSGKGNAVRRGASAARGKYLIYTDIEHPYTVESVKRVMEALWQGADIAAGSRNERYFSSLPPLRYLVSRSLITFNQFILRLPTPDTQCGLKGMNRRGKEVLFQTTIDGFLFDLEFIRTAHRLKLQVVAVPVELRPEIRLTTHILKNILKETINFIKIIFHGRAHR